MGGAQTLGPLVPVQSEQQLDTTDDVRRKSLLAKGLAVATVAGFAARIVLSWISLGSNDWATWWGFSSLVAHHGPFKAYWMRQDLNHPPLPLLWSGLALGISILTHMSFPFVFRLAAIAADVGSSVVLYKGWARRRPGDAFWGWLAAAAFAWNLDAIMDGAYHCNTDNICAFLTLLSAYYLADRRNFFAGGLALMGAINVKIVPVVLIPAMLSLCRTRPDAKQFLKGLAIGAVPFLVVLCVVPIAFTRNVFLYNSMAGEWGLMVFVMYSQYIPLTSAKAMTLTAWIHQYGKYPLLAIAAGLGWVGWRWRRWDAYEMGALGWCVFLIFTPGWGLQYTVYVAPLLMAAHLGRGALYGLTAGLYLLTAYAGMWRGELPLKSIFGEGPPHPNPLPIIFAMLAWGTLVSFFALTLWRGVTRREQTSAGLQAPRLVEG